MTMLKQLPVTDYAHMVQWILKYTKNAKVCLFDRVIVELQLTECIDIVPT